MGCFTKKGKHESQAKQDGNYETNDRDGENLSVVRATGTLPESAQAALSPTILKIMMEL